MTAPDPAIVGTVPAAPPKPDVDESGGKPVPPARKPSCNPEGAYDDLVALFQKLQAARGRRLFALVELGQFGISPHTLEQVYAWKSEIKAVADDGPIDILLHSPGGGLTWCYQIARLLSRWADEWDALVPEIAASGATLISLGSANVVMGDMACLGPIDPQVLSKRNEKVFASERQSPLEAFEAVTYLRSFALTSVIANMRFLRDAGIAPKPALENANDLAFHLVQPILSKIEPYDLGAFALDSRLSAQYCERIAQPDNPAKRTQRNANYRSLVEKYPAHEFIVDFEEAKALGFKVSEPEDDIEEIFDEIRTELEKKLTESFIGLVPEIQASP
jgi:hypothetical protein